MCTYCTDPSQPTSADVKPTACARPARVRPAGRRAAAGIVCRSPKLLSRSARAAAAAGAASGNSHRRTRPSLHNAAVTGWSERCSSGTKWGDRGGCAGKGCMGSMTARQRPPTMREALVAVDDRGRCGPIVSFKSISCVRHKPRCVAPNSRSRKRLDKEGRISRVAWRKRGVRWKRARISPRQAPTTEGLSSHGSPRGVVPQTPLSHTVNSRPRHSYTRLSKATRGGMSTGG